MNQAAAARVLLLADTYAQGREQERALKRRIRALPCTFKGGEGPCYTRVLEPGNRCAACQDQDPLFQALRQLQRGNRATLRRLELAGLRLPLPDHPEPPPEPKPLLDLLDQTEVVA